MAKYPGDIILNEIGTRADMAKAYGVSERTIYRWLNKAADESGIKLRAKTRRPRTSTLEKFTGTRKQLAKKYGVSERTAYRWLKKARDAGADIPKRQRKSKYPGPSILVDNRTSRQIADELGVTPQTVRRWKRRAMLETAHEPEQPEPQQPQDTTPPLEDVGEPWEVPEPEDIGEPWEVPEPEDVGEPWEVPEPEDVGEPWEVPEPEDVGEPWEVPEMSDRQFAALEDIANLLIDAEILEPDSLFFTIPEDMRAIYLNEYIQFQYDKDPYMFEDSPKVKGPDLRDPSKIVNVNIWGGDFEEWLSQQIELNNL